MHKTSEEYDLVIRRSRDIFSAKMLDYCSTWRTLSLPSLTDQIFIKIRRIKTIQNKGEQKIDDSIYSEFIAMLNYCVMALINLEKGVVESPDMNLEETMEKYDNHILMTKELMLDKNHDYDDAWRSMRVSSITDLIFQKVLRIKNIEDNDGKTTISENVDSNYQDIINYSVFAMIRLGYPV
ncbi:DUF1599 domain-containing protein [Ichthyobacterium seriolicida]|uniref:Nucleotide modification associated domain-containing protein n=1 Tax=Ichthyobacterium seriolicida TaxID=242600 RepID=A0A1J1E5L5_9FLAO|nr:DUF1599 domain-containing protein [Ichthyobacterium seriolicida]BAV95340.1 hypothetical protein JBKA6_1327 [Ichthyobacterium seriolicida]